MAKKKEVGADTTKNDKVTKIKEVKEVEEIEKVDKIEEIEDKVEDSSISIQEIKKTIDKKQEFPKETKEKINKYIFHNILVAVIIMVYFIFLNLGQMNIGQEIYITDLKVFSMCILLLAIGIIEKAYKNDDGSIALYGIEMIILSLITVALIYVDLMLSERYRFIVASISYAFAIYYLIKCIIIYLKNRKKYFVDNMKEIINNKEE